MKKSLINFDNALLFEYSKWEISNKGNWNILSYLNTFYCINDVLAISKLLFPEFMLVNNCIILGFMFDEKIYKQWAKEFDEIGLIEKQCNFYYIDDYFHINVKEYENEELKLKAHNEFAMLLAVAWNQSCKSLFPDRSIRVELISEYGKVGITLYTDDSK